MRILLFVFCLFGFFGAHSPILAAAEIPHYAVIINQVRGTECCDVGSIDAFREQQRALQDRNLAATFTIRYDALTNTEFVTAIKNYPDFEYGGLLEITPSLAAAAKVEYRGTPENWFEAQHVFLVGYSQDERAALIDAYMKQFAAVFNTYPETTNAWMIDPFSLQYLREQYGVVTHEITREQFGTDSYTLYGGPPHYPYWSGEDWAFMPSESAQNSTLILRQTITDPVYNYGDQTSAFTSQPNDYRLRGADTSYFSHLFLQAHNQPVGNGYTYAQLGIENSLTQENQEEFFRQLDIVSDWQAKANNTVVTAQGFYAIVRALPVQQISVYHGASQNDPDEQAWWITTPKYRVRLRLSDEKLSITDLRVYDEQFPDPYLTDTAKSMGWWIVPFVLDGSRGSSGTQVGQAARNDVLKNRPSSYPNVSSWLLLDGVTNSSFVFSKNGLQFEVNNKPLIEFLPNSFELLQSVSKSLDSQPPVNSYAWTLRSGEQSWGFLAENDVFTSFSNPELLAGERKDQKLLLFPEIQLGEPHSEKTSLYINNRYAIAGRNPARLVLFPRDRKNFPVLLAGPPTISLSSTEATASSLPAHGSNGMIFIDIDSQEPIRVIAKISTGKYSQEETVYLAPNCAREFLYCLTHPQQAYWYARSVLSDKFRFLEQKKQFEEQVH